MFLGDSYVKLYISWRSKNEQTNVFYWYFFELSMYLFYIDEHHFQEIASASSPAYSAFVYYKTKSQLEHYNLKQGYKVILSNVTNYRDP